MTAAPNATRMTTNAITRDRDLLAREARDIAARATRFAEDVQLWYTRAVRYDAVQETAGLYNTELGQEET